MTKRFMTYVNDAPVAHVTNFMSWGRLIQQLSKAGEFRQNEIVSHLDISEDGIIYGVRTREGR